MPAYLLYSTANHLDNSTGRSAVIAVGASEAAARTAAIAAQPDGETKVRAGWSVLLLADTEHADLVAAGGLVWIKMVVEPLRVNRGS